MYNHYRVATLEDLIKYVKIKINDPNYDSLYQRRLEDFLENNIKKKYGNIPVVSANFLVKKYNEKRSNQISEENQFYYEDKEFANIFEEKSRLKTKSKKYSLISIEYYNGYPILIAGVLDGLSFERNKAKIFEVKSFNLNDFIQYVKELRNYILIKKVFNKIKISSIQLISYRYLLERTQEFGLIGKKDESNLYGKIYLHSENIEYLDWARKTIEQNFNIIKKYVIEYKYDAYNLSLKDGESININNKKIYYFEIDFRVEYNQKILENYLKNLNELIKSLK